MVFEIIFCPDFVIRPQPNLCRFISSILDAYPNIGTKSWILDFLTPIAIVGRNREMYSFLDHNRVHYTQDGGFDKLGARHYAHSRNLFRFFGGSCMPQQKTSEPKLSHPRPIDPYEDCGIGGDEMFRGLDSLPPDLRQDIIDSTIESHLDDSGY